MPASKLKSLSDHLKAQNPKRPPLKVKTKSAHLKAQNPNCPPQSFEP